MIDKNNLGLIGKNTSKVTLLKLLISDFLASTYYDNALYDLARYYKNTSKNDLAITYYDKLLSETNDQQFIAIRPTFIAIFKVRFGKIQYA